jgi:hypothetical protein
MNNSNPPEAERPSSDRSPNGNSSRRLGWALLLVATALTGLIFFVGFNQRYWLLPPEEKLISSWKSDLQLIGNTKQAAMFKRVGKVRVRANDHSPAQEWVEKIHPPIDIAKNGDILADIFLIHQIEGHRYGVVVQYEFIDMKTNNKVGEFARTLWLGIYY